MEGETSPKVDHLAYSREVAFSATSIVDSTPTHSSTSTIFPTAIRNQSPQIEHPI